MAVAAPARRSSAPATAPPPSRTSPPRPRRPKKKAAPDGGAAAPARRKAARAAAAAPAPTRRKAARAGAAAPAPARRKAPSRAPARRAPARKPARRATPGQRVAAGGRLIPLAVGRTAVAVRELPDSGLVVRMTRGRAWIAVLGALLAGIVALNVVTLSFAASSSKVDARNTALEQENTMLESRLAHGISTKKTRHEASVMGLAMPTTEEPTVIQAGPDVVAKAAQRLAAAG